MLTDILFSQNVKVFRKRSCYKSDVFTAEVAKDAKETLNLG